MPTPYKVLSRPSEITPPPSPEGSGSIPASGSVPLTFAGDYSLEKMVERAVRNARPHRTTEAPRWVAVMDVFAYGSTTSHQLCRHFGLDPYERVQGARCMCEDED